MVVMSYPHVSWDNALAREQVRFQCHWDGWQLTDLSDRLTLHEDYPAQQLHSNTGDEKAIQEECSRAAQSILELCKPSSPPA